MSDLSKYTRGYSESETPPIPGAPTRTRDLAGSSPSELSDANAPKHSLEIVGDRSADRRRWIAVGVIALLELLLLVGTALALRGGWGTPQWALIGGGLVLANGYFVVRERRHARWRIRRLIVDARGFTTTSGAGAVARTEWTDRALDVHLTIPSEPGSDRNATVRGESLEVSSVHVTPASAIELLESAREAGVSVQEREAAAGNLRVRFIKLRPA